MPPRILILTVSGTNRDRDAALACELAGGKPEVVHISELLSGARRLSSYQMLVLPGGFSYGDDLGAGRILATDLLYSLGGRAQPAEGASALADTLAEFAESGKPILGICNGFQALVKAGLLPGPIDGRNGQLVTLVGNASNRFECRWVYLRAEPGSPCIFTRSLDGPIYCPVAHGEGRFIPLDEAILAAIERHKLVAVRYVDANGDLAGYPYNPNGSVANIAGICNEKGNIFGLMPHPEDHVFPWQHPRWARGEEGASGLALFRNGIAYAAQF
jgi:phosphoribosylformylglycinamidine synthase I